MWHRAASSSSPTNRALGRRCRAALDHLPCLLFLNARFTAAFPIACPIAFPPAPARAPSNTARAATPTASMPVATAAGVTIAATATVPAVIVGCTPAGVGGICRSSTRFGRPARMFVARSAPGRPEGEPLFCGFPGPAPSHERWFVGAAPPLVSGAALLGRPHGMRPSPNLYLRVVATTACPMRCSYCHREGDPGTGGLPLQILTSLVGMLAGIGATKIKWLGGEPIARSDIAAHIGAVRELAPGADLSVITSGTAPLARLRDCFAAGLDRANLSIHGWSEPAFIERGGRHALYRTRQESLAWLLEHGAPLKLNFVYRGSSDEQDLSALLNYGATTGACVNVLDDLTRSDLGPDVLLAALRRLRGREDRLAVASDPASLDTLHLRWGDGLWVEIKHQSLGTIAPWTACGSCPKRSACKEGITALRLSHDGVLRPCMDRPDLGLPLVPILESGGDVAAAAMAWLDANQAERLGVAARMVA